MRLYNKIGILALSSVFALTGLIGSNTNNIFAMNNDESSKSINTTKKDKKDFKIKKKVSRSTKNSGVFIDDQEIKTVPINKKLSLENYRLDLTKEQEQAVSDYNAQISQNGGSEGDLIPISIEVQTIDEAQKGGNILVNISDIFFNTKSVNAANYTIKKVNYWGAGYEVYKNSSGDIFYCVHYGPLATTKYNKYDDFNKFLKNKRGWSQSKIDNSKKYALWGTYYNKTKKDVGYIASAQSLIWDGSYHPGATANKKNTIKNRASKHTTNVSFNNQNKSLKPGQSITLTDSKGELDQFELNNATDFTNKTGIKISKSGNKLTFSNPAGNKKSASNVKLTGTKYKNHGFKGGKGFGLYAGNTQELALFTENSAPTFNVSFTSMTFVTDKGYLKVIKDMKDEDFYGKLIKDENDNPIYTTEDGKHKVIEGLTIDMIKYPEKAEMVKNELFGKNISYEYPELVNKKVLADKLDENGQPVYVLDNDGNKIPKKDENGNTILDPNTQEPVYEIVQEEVNAKDLEGNDIFVPVLDKDGNPVMKSRTLDKKYGTEREMDNIYRGVNIQFQVRNSSGQVVAVLNTGANGEATSGELEVGKYTIKETVTKEGFVLSTKTYTETVTKDNTTIINGGKALMNYKNMADLNIKKIDELTGKGIKDVLFTIYKSKEGVCPTSAQEMIKDDEDLLWAGKTDEEGHIDWNTGKAQTICVAEKETIPGYMLNDTVHTVKLELGKTAEIIQKNNSLKVKLHVKKLGHEDVTLPGTEFKLELFDSNEELVREYKDLVIDEEGYIHIEYSSLNPFFDKDGNSYKHVLTETKALDDYVLKEPIHFYLAMDKEGKVVLDKDEFTFLSNLTGEDEQEVEMKVNNELKGTYGKLIKTSKNDKSRQKATYKFEFYDQEGKVYDEKEMKSRTEGVDTSFPVYFKLTSKVCATEIEAPKDHILDKTKKCLETRDFNEDKVMEFKFENEAIELAKTGFNFWSNLFNFAK